MSDDRDSLASANDWHAAFLMAERAVTEAGARIMELQRQARERRCDIDLLKASLIEALDGWSRQYSRYPQGVSPMYHIDHLRSIADRIEP